MDYNKRWKVVKELDAGGQGIVYLVEDQEKVGVDPYNFSDETRELTRSPTLERRAQAFEALKDAISKIAASALPENQGALKVLHKAQEARDADRAVERLKREIKSMRDIQHPNLLKIIDADIEDKWFVSEYHERGSLDRQIGQFTGDAESSLKALRPVVQGVALLHEKGQVHRDIKPANIFVASDDRLILGDFGLVYFTDSSKTRLSGAYENVGSTDWMPAWATRMRIDDIEPNFDIFCLGKILWAMVSEEPILRLWYFQRDEFNLEQMFPNNPHMGQINSLLSKCIVEENSDCLPNAGEFLEEIDKTLAAMDLDIENSDGVGNRCRVCGRGTYQPLVNEDADKTRNFGLNPAGNRRFRVIACEYCGNVQLFTRGGGFEPQFKREAE